MKQTRKSKSRVLLGALMLFKCCAFFCLGQSSFSCGDVHKTNDYLSDSCCVQETERRKCVDDEFCTGVVISHPSSFLNACCDDYESCGATKKLFQTLDILEKLSVTDFVISTIIIAVLLMKVYFKFNYEDDRKRGCTIALAGLEFFAFVLNLSIVIFAVNGTALITAEDLKDAECFTTADDAATIGDTINHLKHYRLIAILEAIFDLVLLVIHALEVCLEDREGSNWSLMESTGLVLDIGEEFFAAINLFLLLRPAMRALDDLYDSLAMDPDASANRTSQPCIYSCCLAFLVNTTIALPPMDPPASPPQIFSPAPTFATSILVPTEPTAKPSLQSTQNPNKQPDPVTEPTAPVSSIPLPTKSPTPGPTSLPTKSPTAGPDLSPPPSKDSSMSANPVIETCASDFSCATRVCVKGVCMEKQQLDFAPCDSNADCVNGSCYLEKFSEQASEVCCPEGSVYASANEIPWANSGKYFCRYQQVVGEACAKNNMCASGVCVDGICMESKQANLKLCDDNDDCESARCYLQNFSEDAQTVCCPDGYVSVLSSDIPWANAGKYFCRYQQANGESCASNLLCASGVCVDGKCASGKIKNLNHCDDNNDCESGRCYLQNFSEDAQTVCCPDGYVVVSGGDIPWSNSDKYFCRYQQANGESCTNNALCASGVCVDGKCASGKIENLNHCDDNNDCESGSCYLQNFSEDAQVVCCPDGYVSVSSTDIPWANTGKTFCRYQQADGLSCASNALCASGVCVDGKCASGKIENLENCDNNDDCGSGRCHLETFSEDAQTVCCPDSYISISSIDIPWSNTGKTFCRYQQADGLSCASNLLCESGVCVDGNCASGKIENLERCDDNNDCVSGRCYLQNFSEDAQTVCCPDSYISISSTVIPWSNTGKTFCRYQQANGESCASNLLCESGVCVDGKCASGKIENLERCDDNNDCVSGRCYLQNFSEDAQTVCCPDSYISISSTVIPWSNTGKTFCRYQQADGLSCTSNLLCASGVCVDGKCASGKIENLERCDDNNDCVSGRCYLQTFYEDAQTVCCPDSYISISSTVIPWSNTGKTFCRYQQADGRSCASNLLCESGVCVDGKCASGKIENLERCDDNNDCVSGRCYLQNFSEDAQTVCCPDSYISISSTVIPWSNTGKTFCRYQQANGESCASNLLCESGVCVDGKCASGKIENLERCDDNNDCVSGRCYLQTFSEDAQTVCCPDSYISISSTVIPWSNTGKTFCRYQQANGESCASNLLCASGKCENGVCVNQ